MLLPTIGMMSDNPDDLQNNSTQTTARMLEQRDSLYQDFYEVRRKMQLSAQENVKRILDEQEMLDAALEKLRKKHITILSDSSPLHSQNEMCNRSIEQQRIAYESVLKQVEDLKREKEMALKKVVELEGKLNEKQMEIVELKAKLQVRDDEQEATSKPSSMSPPLRIVF